MTSFPTFLKVVVLAPLSQTSTPGQQTEEALNRRLNGCIGGQRGQAIYTVYVILTWGAEGALNRRLYIQCTYGEREGLDGAELSKAKNLFSQCD